MRKISFHACDPGKLELSDHSMKLMGFCFKLINKKLHITKWMITLIFEIFIMILQDRHNLTLPSWTKKVYPKRLQELLDLFLYKEFSELSILRLVVGEFETILVNGKKRIPVIFPAKSSF